MSGTKSHSRKAPATELRNVVLIAFGSISDPCPQDEALRALAEKVNAKMPDWNVQGATMTADGSIGRAFDILGGKAIVFPLLMADGWILRKVLPDALKAAGQKDVSLLTPLGLLPAFHAHCAKMIRAGISNAEFKLEETTVVLAAHGSARGPRPSACARALCKTLVRATGVRDVVPGYLEEAPFLTDVLKQAPYPAVCLPCFVTNAYHATSDVPQAIAESGFDGNVLTVAGTDPGMVDLITGTLNEIQIQQDAA